MSHVHTSIVKWGNDTVSLCVLSARTYCIHLNLNENHFSTSLVFNLKKTLEALSAIRIILKRKVENKRENLLIRNDEKKRNDI
jgi:hypothetical protein